MFMKKFLKVTICVRVGRVGRLKDYKIKKARNIREKEINHA